MMDNYNYPMGADTADAPWNREDDDVEVEVYVEIMVSKTIKMKTINYDIDENGGRYIGDLHSEIYEEIKDEVPEGWEFEGLNYEL